MRAVRGMYSMVSHREGREEWLVIGTQFGEIGADGGLDRIRSAIRVQVYLL